MYLRLQSRQAVLGFVSCKQVSSCFLSNECLSGLTAAGDKRQGWAEAAQVCKHNVCLLCLLQSESFTTQKYLFSLENYIVV